MAYPTSSIFRLFQNIGRAITGNDFDYNFNQIIGLWKGSPTKYDLNAANITADSVVAPIIGNSTSVLYGNASNLTGLNITSSGDVLYRYYNYK